MAIAISTLIFNIVVVTGLQHAERRRGTIVVKERTRKVCRN